MTKTEYKEQGTTLEGRAWNGESLQPTNRLRATETGYKEQEAIPEDRTEHEPKPASQPASLAKSNGERTKREEEHDPDEE
ncbi:hypothetical protein K0M31_015481 [Melipona bicolor]|uniref:Uncharacterized protein n=1 Tax=Melipona bicolor TaxID=60889 RepID=A0AA40FFS2_9HYME|nr:hypothetical protein K0M31_015481 [Melipona bicolor]